ncbi:MAG: hypothetical protein AAB460_00945 [Patescibacteria group bacterium]
MDVQKAEQMLWQRADELSAERDALSKKSDELFQICGRVRKGELKGADLVKLEGRYWEIQRRLEAITAEEAEIVLDLEMISRGVIPEKFAESAQSALSKRRQAIASEEARMLPREDEDQFWEAYVPGYQGKRPKSARHQAASNGRFLTTGRHATHVTGQLLPEIAPDAFFEATADTHGGKVRGGSKPVNGTYISKGGKAIRKF